MNIKKILTLLFTLITILVLSGCGTPKGQEFIGTWYQHSITGTYYKIIISQEDDHYIINAKRLKYIEDNKKSTKEKKAFVLTDIDDKTIKAYPISDTELQIHDEYNKAIIKLKNKNTIKGDILYYGSRDEIIRDTPETKIKEEVNTRAKNTIKFFHKSVPLVFDENEP